ncbi:hypothetical protein [Bradyrhizobium sp. USDA 4508]
MTGDDWRPGPETPRAHHFEAGFCDDPNCGIHIVAFTADHTPICEIVTSARQTLALVEICRDYLYDKATRRPT